MDNFNKKNSPFKFKENLNFNEEEDDFYVKEIDWRDDRFVLEKKDLYDEKVFNKMLMECKDDLLVLITKGSLQFTCSDDAALLLNKKLIKSWLKNIKESFSNGPHLSAGLFVRLYLDEKENVTLQILWEVPLSQINDRYLLNNAIVVFCNNYRRANKNSNVKLILNKKDYNSSNLIGVIFSTGVFEDKKLDYRMINV